MAPNTGHYITRRPRRSFDQEFEKMVIEQEKFMSKVQAERNSKLESDRKNKLCVHKGVSGVVHDMSSEYANHEDLSS